MSSMPKQKRGESKQDYQTPPEFLTTLKHKMQIEEFGLDIAASHSNAICPNYYTEEDNAFDHSWKAKEHLWSWLNPPFNNITDWVRNSYLQAITGAYIVMLVPASVGSNWWANYVDDVAYVMFLNGRLTFVGQTDPYPKDCALLFYTPIGFKGNAIWNWVDYFKTIKNLEVGDGQVG